MKFMALYVGSPQAMAQSGWATLDEQTRRAREAAGMQAWFEWGEKHKAATVVEGGPLGKTKRVGKDGVSDITNSIAGYIIVEAPSHEAAAKMFENHPHFSIFPGEAVEIMPCNPIPSPS
jgi:hypothetical protein